MKKEVKITGTVIYLAGCVWLCILCGWKVMVAMFLITVGNNTFLRSQYEKTPEDSANEILKEFLKRGLK